MSYFTKNVSGYGTEKSFLIQFKNALTASSGRIVCTTNDLDDQFSNTNNIPYLNFLIDGKFNVKLVRNGKLSNAQSAYYVHTDFTGSMASTGQLISFGSSSMGYLSDSSRTWKFAVAENTNALHLRLASYNASLRSPQEGASTLRVIDLMVIHEGDNYIAAFNTIYNASSHSSVMDAAFYLHGDTIISLTSLNRLSYTYDPLDISVIETIHEKVFLTGSTTDRQITVTSLHDCSAINREQMFTMSGKKYYSVSSNTLLEV